MVEGAEIHKQVQELAEAHKHEQFNRMVALTVAVLALCMVLGKVKESNIQTRAMATLMEQLDAWNVFQDKSIKEHMFDLEVQHARLMQGMPGLGMTPATQQQLAAALAKWQGQAETQASDKSGQATRALNCKAKHQALEVQDQQLTFAEALMTLAITLFAVSALIKSKHLYGMGLGVAVVGIVMELSGFLSWNLHLGFLRFLT